MKPQTIHAIPHTHWDFEWYFTRHEAFVQFCYHMDEVLAALADGRLHNYLLDGQMSILDDYLTAFPDKKAQVARFVKGKQLFIGPWYTQTDELVISGESILRNLNLGMKLADQLGGAMMVGYLPDSFGQGKDMPKIYRGLGIKHALFWRGMPHHQVKKTEFNWQADDGSQVLVENIKNGYFAGVPLIESKMSVKESEDYVHNLVKDAATTNTALPVGGDQRYVDFNFQQRLMQMNDRLKNTPYHLVESNYPALFRAIEKENRELETVSGEFVDPSVSKIHRSIYSSRYDLKYENDRLERRILFELEPLMTLADSYGIPYHQSLLDKLWRLMVRNHAHDSAGGCNSDQTNRDIKNRMVEADQLSYSIIDYLTRKLAISRPEAQENDLLLFNGLPFAQDKVMTLNLSVKTPNVRLWHGKEAVPFDLLTRKKVYAGSIQRDERHNDPDKYYYELRVRIRISLAATSYTALRVEPLAQETSPLASVAQKMIENDHYRVTFAQGQLQLVDKKRDRVYDHILTFADGGDEGDTYDYSPAYQDQTYHFAFEQAAVTIMAGQLAQEMTITGNWTLPTDLKARAAKRAETTVPYRLTLTLKKGQKQLEFKLKVDNRVKDHRLRAIFNVDLPSQQSFSDSQFGVIKRPVVDPHAKGWQQIGYHEEPSTIYPLLHYVNLHDQDRSVTVMTKGIKEYQVVGQQYHRLALTLFRSVGFLGRPDLIRRPGKASGNEFKYIPTPDSQLQTNLTCKFALQLDDQFDPAAIMRAYQGYASRVPYHQNQNLNLFVNTLQYFVMNRLPLHKRTMPVLQVPEQLVFSSLHKTADQTGVTLRVYNPSSQEARQDMQIKLDGTYQTCLLDLRDRPVTAVQTGSFLDAGDFKPGEIKTFGIYNKL